MQQTLEREKHKNLKGEVHADHASAPLKQAPGWNQNLASKAEAEVKVRSLVHRTHRIPMFLFYLYL
jgi:hypothetical protein